MNSIELSKEHFVRLQIKNDVKIWLKNTGFTLKNTEFTNFTTDDIDFISEIVCHYLSNRNTVLQFEDREYVYFKKYNFFLRYLSYLAMISVGRNHSCDFKFVTDGNLSKKYNFFASLMKKTNVQCNAEFISYEDFLKNPELDKYTIFNYHVNEDFMRQLLTVSWNHGLVFLR